MSITFSSSPSSKERQKFPLIIAILLFKLNLTFQLTGKADVECGKYSTLFSSTWNDPNAVATVTAHDAKALPHSLHGVPFVRWRDAPTTLQEWADVDGQNLDDEPDFEPTKGLKQAAGVVIQEDDGRVWVIHPTNAFGGYQATFSKGTLDDCLPFQASAIKEAYEKSGLKVEITGFIGDFERTTSVSRYYTARRVGGNPGDMGWESQGVSLVPKNMLSVIANHKSDIPLINIILSTPSETQ